MTNDELELVAKLYDYTCALESAFSVWALTRPQMAKYPGTVESRTQLGHDVCVLLGREWPPQPKPHVAPKPGDDGLCWLTSPDGMSGCALPITYPHIHEWDTPNDHVAIVSTV